MILSDDRVNHWAHLLTDGVWEDDLLDFSDDDSALRVAKLALREFVKEESELDRKAKEKVASLKRGVLEGSPEFEILYKKYLEEERSKRG